MRRGFNPSLVAVGLASAALFISLGGPAWAAGLISGSRIKPGSITGSPANRPPGMNPIVS